eukprot:TRINITY_DN17207_c0_g1_i1.p2 TRINITY_DN17207_c0_g1~~TRINITY_DN17207_c0_g1_i1.p2  ORF type:complete len:102 (-),score=18.06 TRINITY_DN17207_c0_g1_i1:3-308(-)
MPVFHSDPFVVHMTEDDATNDVLERVRATLGVPLPVFQKWRMRLGCGQEVYTLKPGRHILRAWEGLERETGRTLHIAMEHTPIVSPSSRLYARKEEAIRIA